MATLILSVAYAEFHLCLVSDECNYLSVTYAELIILSVTYAEYHLC